MNPIQHQEEIRADYERLTGETLPRGAYFEVTRLEAHPDVEGDPNPVEACILILPPCSYCGEKVVESEGGSFDVLNCEDTPEDKREPVHNACAQCVDNMNNAF